MNTTDYFKQLRAIKQKQIRTEHHLSNLIHYEYNESIPNGLQIKIKPKAPGNLSNTSLRRWDQTLYHCSKRLVVLLKQHCEEHLKTLTGEFNTLLNSCKRDLTSDNCDAINTRLKDITTIQSKHLNAKTKPDKSEGGIVLDQSQINFLNQSWHCDNPLLLSTYKEEYGASFPVSDKSAHMLNLQKIEDITQTLLCKQHGPKAGIKKFTVLYKGFVYTFKNETSSGPKRFFSLTGYTSVSDVEDKDISDLWIFKLLHSDKKQTELFAAPSHTEYINWVERFAAEIQWTNAVKHAYMNGLLPHKVQSEIELENMYDDVLPPSDRGVSQYSPLLSSSSSCQSLTLLYDPVSRPTYASCQSSGNNINRGIRSLPPPPPIPPKPSMTQTRPKTYSSSNLEVSQSSPLLSPSSSCQSLALLHDPVSRPTYDSCQNSGNNIYRGIRSLPPPPPIPPKPSMTQTRPKTYSSSNLDLSSEHARTKTPVSQKYLQSNEMQGLGQTFQKTSSTDEDDSIEEDEEYYNTIANSEDELLYDDVTYDLNSEPAVENDYEECDGIQSEEEENEYERTNESKTFQTKSYVTENEEEKSGSSHIDNKNTFDLPEIRYCVIAIKDYRANDETELDFNEEEKFHVIGHESKRWLIGEKNGKRGLFPAEYVKVYLYFKHFDVFISD
ncbi:unnamed protein product [Mytilus coruscus]|uniref:SH3 domain-containing protein n=1 Tax=Mytilus coruscus TaxID=42192 RepID=A0A6J8EUY9_MYTCO|nr:unnamed protein product [Mytilus coruscus]